MAGTDLTPEMLLRAYAAGIFPMAESRDTPNIFWVDPRRRGVIPLDNFHISKSLRRRLIREDYTIHVNTDFEGVVNGCAQRDETWINDTIFNLYRELFLRGHAHALEVWDGQELVGGVYGVTLGAAFFGESMFSHRPDTSKIALAYLVDHLQECGFMLLDTQFITPHLQSLGAIEISREEYHDQLNDALQHSADFCCRAEMPNARQLLQRSTQTS